MENIARPVTPRGPPESSRNERRLSPCCAVLDCRAGLDIVPTAPEREDMRDSGKQWILIGTNSNYSAICWIFLGVSPYASRFGKMIRSLVLSEHGGADVLEQSFRISRSARPPRLRRPTRQGASPAKAPAASGASPCVPARGAAPGRPALGKRAPDPIGGHCARRQRCVAVFWLGARSELPVPAPFPWDG